MVFSNLLVKYRMTRIRHCTRSKLCNHNPLSSSILLIGIRLQKPALVRHLPVLNVKPVQQGRTVEQMIERHLADLQTTGPVPQKAPGQPLRYDSRYRSFDGFDDLLFTGPQPNVHVTVRIAIRRSLLAGRFFNITDLRASRIR